MSINKFYQETLGANLKNPQWSWGAFNPLTNRVFLRVWKDEIEPSEGGERVLVLRKTPRTKSNGYAERKNQLDIIKEGAEGIGIVCTAVDPLTKGKRTIADFDKNTFLRFGEIIDDDGNIYALVDSHVTIDELQQPQTAQSTLTADIKSIIKQKGIGSTEKEALVNARVGQGAFRTAVLQLWNGCCSVTGSTTLDAIRASHIKPWRDSTDSERLDPYNGIPLVASLDALFDAGLISFHQSGQILISGKLSASECEIFGIAGKSLAKQPPPETAAYLAHHKEKIFRK